MQMPQHNVYYRTGDSLCDCRTLGDKCVPASTRWLVFWLGRRCTHSKDPKGCAGPPAQPCAPGHLPTGMKAHMGLTSLPAWKRPAVTPSPSLETSRFCCKNLVDSGCWKATWSKHHGSSQLLGRARRGPHQGSPPGIYARLCKHLLTQLVLSAGKQFHPEEVFVNIKFLWITKTSISDFQERSLIWDSQISL